MADRTGRHFPAASNADASQHPQHPQQPRRTHQSQHNGPPPGVGASRRPGVSRNLFKSQLTRRPTAPTTTAGSRYGTSAGSATVAGQGNRANGTGHGRSVSPSGNSAEALGMGGDVDIHGADSLEFVARDKHGEIEIGELPMAALMDEAEEGLVLDQEQSKKERQRLAEAVKQHQTSHPTMPDQPEVFLDAVKKSLKAKVTALEEDQWMFEPGDSTLRR